MRSLKQAILPGAVIGLAVLLVLRAAHNPPVAASSDSSTNHWGYSYGSSEAASTNINPVAHFRELMMMAPADREKSLATETESRRNWLKIKLVEYEAMDSKERELRFRTTELRWYLLPLMRMPAATRVEWHATVPRDYHAQVEARLKQWDRLSSDLQKEVIENELTMAYFIRLEGSSRAQQKAMLDVMPQEKREKLERDLDAFRALAPGRRENMLSHFNRFFEMNDEEKTRIVGELPRGEREQMKKMLLTFEKLSPGERQNCIESFAKFANMSREEQLVFLKNAELWRSMTSAERQLWRDMNDQLPPLPQGAGHPPLPDAGPTPPPLPHVTEK